MREPRWDDYASYTGGGSKEWHDVWWRRLKTVDSYWRGSSMAPVEHTSLLRTKSAVGYGMKRKSIPRPTVVMMYESIVKFMLAWIKHYLEEIEKRDDRIAELQRERDRLSRTAAENQRVAVYAQQRADENEKEAAALRWALELAYKARSRNDDDTT